MNELKVNIVDDNVFILFEDVVVESLGYSITVKKGFDFDGASIPKWLWSIYGSPLNGNYVVVNNEVMVAFGETSNFNLAASSMSSAFLAIGG